MLDLPDSHFDGVFANAVLFHVPSQELPRVLLELHAEIGAAARSSLSTSNCPEFIFEQGQALWAVAAPAPRTAMQPPHPGA